MKPAIGIDIDEVTADFIGPLIKYKNKTSGVNLKKKDYFSFNLEEVWGGTREEAIKFVSDFYKTKEFDEILPLEGAIPGIISLKDQFDLIFITARHSEGAEKTKGWIEKHLGEIPCELIISSEFDGREATKAEICIAKEIGIMLEDNSKNALECAEAGVNTILFDRPWNQGAKHDNMVRVYNWSEALQEVARIQAGNH